MFTEPTYHFNIKENVPYQIGTKQSYPNGPYVSVFENAVITYSGLEVPFGIKNHWFLDDVNFLNLHAGVSFNIPMNSTIKSSPKIKGKKFDLLPLPLSVWVMKTTTNGVLMSGTIYIREYFLMISDL